MTAQPSSQPSSPHTTKAKPIPHDTSNIIPLSDASRTIPIHQSLPTVKLPSTDTQTLNPLTLKPFTTEDLKHHNYHALRSQYDAESAAKAREEAVLELKSRLEENERKAKEIEREMEEKEKTREIERKVYNKRRGDGGAG